MKNYAEKLKDPRWEQRRLEVLNANGHQCTFCCSYGDLRVHHRFYENGREPWEYPNGAFIVLCEKCHGLEHEDWIRLTNKTVHLLRKCGFTQLEFEQLNIRLGDLARITEPREAIGIILGSIGRARVCTENSRAITTNAK